MRRPELTKIEWVVLGLLVAGVAAAIASFGMYRAASSRVASLRAGSAEITRTASEAVRLAGIVRASESRKGLVKVAGISAALEQVAEPIGLKKRMKSQRALPGVLPTEEKSEAVFEAITMNEAVNLLYSIDTAPMLLITRKATLKTSFKERGKLDLVLNVSLIKPE